MMMMIIMMMMIVMMIMVMSMSLTVRNVSTYYPTNSWSCLDDPR